LNYPEFCVLSVLNTWPDDGFPVGQRLAEMIANMVRGDPRGDVTPRECQTAIQSVLAKGWARLDGEANLRITDEGKLVQAVAAADEWKVRK
jgi:hypothetical protein